jgi:hypothetical protein
MKKELVRSKVDRLALIRQEMKRLKTEEDQIKNDLGSLNEKFIEGNKFVLMVRDSERTGLDLDRVRDEMGVFWYEQHLVTTYFQRFDVESKESQL